MTVAELEIIVSARLEKLDAKLDEAKAKAKKGGGEAGKQLAESLSQGFGQAIGNFSVQGVIDGVKSLVRGMVEGNAEMETYTVQFGVLLKSTKEAKERMAELAKFAADTPFELPEIVAASKQLQVMGGTALATGQTLKMVGDMAAASGAGYQEVATWVGRMYSSLMAGKPFGEATQRLQELGLISGKTRNAMEDLAKEGGQAKDVWELFTKSAQGFDGMMEQQSKTLTGMMGTLKDDFAATLREVGAPVFEAVKSAVGGAIQLFENPEFKGAAKVVAGIVAGLVGLIGSIGAVAAAIVAWQKVAAMFTLVSGAIGGVEGALALLTGPVGWVIAAAALIYAAWKTNFLGIRDFVGSVVKEIVGWWQDNLPMIQNTTRIVLAGIKVLWAGFALYLKTLWDGIVAVLSVAWEAIKGVVLVAMRAISGFLATAMLAINGRWGDAWTMFKLTCYRVFATVMSSLAKTLASMLRAITTFGNQVGQAFGLTFNALDGSTQALDVYAKGWDVAADAAGAAQSKISKSVKALPSLPALAPLRGPISMGGSNSVPVDPGAALGGIRMGGGVGGGGGRAGRSSAPKLSDAQKEEDSQIKEYQALIRSLTQDIALNGKTEASAALAYKLAHGQIAAGAVQLAKRALGLERVKEVQDKARAATEKFTAALKDQQTRLMLLNSTTDKDKYAVETTGKHYADLKGKDKTDFDALWGKKSTADAIEARKKAVDDAAKSATEATRQAIQNAKALNASLGEQIDLWGNASEAQKVAYQLAQKEYDDVPKAMKDEALRLAAEIDRRKAAEEADKAAQKRTEEGIKQDREADKELADRQEAYDDFMGRLNLRASRAKSLADQAKVLVAENTAKMGATLAQRAGDAWLRDAMNDQKMAELMKVKDSIQDAFMSMFDNLWKDGFQNFFGNVVSGFRSMLAQVVQEWVRSQIATLVGRGLTAIMSGTGGAKGLFGRAVGGPVLANTPYVVGENGPELFVPNGGGRVVTNQAAKGLGGGVTVNLNLHGVSDYSSFKHSEGQVNAMAYRAGQEAARGMG